MARGRLDRDGSSRVFVSGQSSVSKLASRLEPGEVIVEADGVPGVTACMRFAEDIRDGDLDVGQRLTVEGRIRARIISACLIETELFPEVLDVEVMDARLARP